MIGKHHEQAPQIVNESWQTLVGRGKNKYVAINEPALTELAGTCQNVDYVPDWRIPGIYAEADRTYALQTVVSSVLNYAFMDPAVPGGKWEVPNPADPSKPYSGANGLHYRTNQVFADATDITAADILQLTTPEGMQSYLPDVPHSESRRRLLGDFASGLKARYGGSVAELLAASVDASGSMRAYNGGDGLVERLLDPSFGDTFTDYASIGDLEFPFNKRAQLLALLYYGRANSSGTLPKLSDVEKLGPAADYQLPRAFRAMGVLRYSAKLAHAINNWAEIPAGLQPEVEIRGATVAAALSLLGQVNELRAASGHNPITMAHLDAWLWLKGRSIPGDIYPHRTPTTAY